jgi:drug/metabolite transporter (DMT)-like permease
MALVYSVSNVPVMIWTITFNTAPFWTALFCFFFLQEKITKRELFCICGAFIGVIVLSLEKEVNEK